MVSKTETLNLVDLRVFAETAKLLNLTAAGTTLGMPKSAVSKALTRLERQLGVKLLERSSRRVALTPAGSLLSVKTESLLSEVDFLTQSLREEKNEPRGIVRITAPFELGAQFIERLVPTALRIYPGLRIAVKLGYDFDDLLEPNIDLAIRAGDVHDDRLVAHAIGTFRRVAIASPKYVAAHPIRRVADLADRACLIFSATDMTANWTFNRGEAVEEVEVKGSLSVRSFSTLLLAARAGLGVTRVPEFIATDDIERGELVRVLPGWASAPTTVYVAHRFGHERIARIGVLLDLLKSQGWFSSTGTAKPSRKK